jgi:phage gpG-like protein
MDRNISQLAGDLQNLGTKLIARVTGILPQVVSAEGLRHFEESWDKQGFTNNNLSKWKKRKPPEKTTNKNGKESATFKRWKQKNAGRAILVSHQTDTKGTHLKDSLRAESNPKQVIFSTDKPYAQVHNEGGPSGRGTGFIMEQRQFMGPSAALDKKIAAKLDKEITKFLKSL